MTAPEIRPITRADRAEWGRLWNGYLTFYESELPDSQYELTFNRLLDPQFNYYGRLAVSEGRAIGLVHWLFHPTGWAERPVCYLQDLYADPRARGKGVGTALIDAVAEEARGAGAENVYWTTQHFNATARSLYDKVATLTPFIKYRKDIR